MTPKLSASQASFFFPLSFWRFIACEHLLQEMEEWSSNSKWIFSLFFIFLDSPGKMLIGTLKVEIIQKNFFFPHFFVNVVSLLQRTSEEEFIIWGLQTRFRVGSVVGCGRRRMDLWEDITTMKVFVLILLILQINSCDMGKSLKFCKTNSLSIRRKVDSETFLELCSTLHTCSSSSP